MVAFQGPESRFENDSQNFNDMILIDMIKDYSPQGMTSE